MGEYFSKLKSFGRVKAELDLANYATKSDLKNEYMLIHQNLLKKLIYTI